MSDLEIKLLSVLQIKGQIEVKTGLHIGTAKSTIEIGGMDNPVIKHPVTGEPYIPGSSIKGKMRSLLELKYNKTRNSEVHSCNDIDCFICRIFGTTARDSKCGPTRIIVRDAMLNKEKTQKNLSALEQDFSPYELVEEKWENVIDRLKGSAGSPRQAERVVPGTVFDFEIIYRLFDLNNEQGEIDKENIKYLKEALDLLEADYLGGSGSRGYGKVKFIIESITCDNKDFAKYAREIFGIKGE